MKETTIWITFHQTELIERYNLKEDETFKLFKGNNLNIKGENINHLNPFYSELTTLYWVYRNNIRSKYVGFCHYRRQFTQIVAFEPTVCQVYQITSFQSSLFEQYKLAHNYNDLYDIIDILNEWYGKENNYSKYLFLGKTFIPFCSFIMHYDDFIKLCDFLFPILFAYDKKNNLNMNPDNYWKYS